MTYQESVEHARDVAVTFGINSKEYKQAINRMKATYQVTEKNFMYKVINLIGKIKWLTKRY